jgi:hypothetical protein
MATFAVSVTIYTKYRFDDIRTRPYRATAERCATLQSGGDRTQGTADRLNPPAG